MVFINNSLYRITISTGPGGQAPTVYGHSREILYSMSGRCMKNLLGTYTATAHGVPAKKKTKPPDQSDQTPRRPAPPPPEEAPEQYTFRVENKCEVPIDIWVRYKAIDDGRWTTKNWKIEAGKGYRLTSGGESIISENAISYYYARLINPASSDRYTWDGSDEVDSRFFTVDGKFRSFRKREPSSGRFVFELECSDYFPQDWIDEAKRRYERQRKSQ